MADVRVNEETAAEQVEGYAQLGFWMFAVGAVVGAVLDGFNGAAVGSWSTWLLAVLCAASGVAWVVVSAQRERAERERAKV